MPTCVGGVGEASNDSFQWKRGFPLPNPPVSGEGMEHYFEGTLIMEMLTRPVSKAARIGGIVMSSLVVLFLLFDAGIKLVPLEIVTETSAQLGLPATVEFARTLAILTLIGVALYAYPRTAMLGAILLTGYMGGAIATHLRIGSPLFSHVLFGFYLGVLIWGGLYLRDPRVRSLIPFRR